MADTPAAPAAQQPAPAAAQQAQPIIHPNAIPAATALDGLPGGGVSLMNSLAAARSEAQNGNEPPIQPQAPSVVDILQQRQQVVDPAAATPAPAPAAAPPNPAPAAAPTAPAPADPNAAPAPADPNAAPIAPPPADPNAAPAPADPNAAPADPNAPPAVKPDPNAAPASTDPIYEVDGQKVSRDELVGKMGDREFQEKVEKGEVRVGIANDDEMRNMFNTQFAPSIESPIFGGQHKLIDNEPPAAAELKFEVPNELNAYVKENFGVDTFEKLTESIPGWRRDSQNFNEASQKVTGFEQIFQSMPNQLYQAVQDHFAGKDWKESVLSTPNLDFDKEVNQHDPLELVEAFYPDKISTEDWEAYSDKESEGHENAVKLIDAFIPEAEKAYNTQKQQFDVLRANEIQTAREKNEAFNESIQSSAKHLKKQLPQAQEGYVDSLVAKFKGGGLQQLFFEEDGNRVKEDALLNYAMSMDGFALYQQMEGAIKNAVQTAERQEILSRGADTPAARGQASDPNAIRPEVQKHLDNVLGGVIPKQQVY